MPWRGSSRPRERTIAQERPALAYIRTMQSLRPRAEDQQPTATGQPQALAALIKRIYLISRIHGNLLSEVSRLD